MQLEEHMEVDNFPIPVDEFLLILTYLDAQDLIYVSRVCKCWNEASKWNPLWNSIYNQYWKRDLPLYHTTGSWKDYFRESLELIQMNVICGIDGLAISNHFGVCKKGEYLKTIRNMISHMQAGRPKELYNYFSHENHAPLEPFMELPIQDIKQLWIPQNQKYLMYSGYRHWEEGDWCEQHKIRYGSIVSNSFDTRDVEASRRKQMKKLFKKLNTLRQVFFFVKGPIYSSEFFKCKMGIQKGYGFVSYFQNQTPQEREKEAKNRIERQEVPALGLDVFQAVQDSLATDSNISKLGEEEPSDVSISAKCNVM